MATETQKPASSNKHDGVSGMLKAAEKDTKPIQAFITKFSNDWAMNFAAALAYNLLMAMLPIAIALLAILGLVLSALSPATNAHLQMQIIQAFPSATNASALLTAATKQLSKDAGFLGIIAIILALFSGSRLFLLMEGCFDIIYHVRPRVPIPQNLMALGMLLLFIILIPVMVFASAAPALIFSFLQNTPVGSIPGSKLIFSLGGIIGGVIAGYILFQSIYIVVPNQKISFRHSWPGAVVAAILLEIFLALFPLYVSHFLTGYLGQALGLIILLIFFYYFAVILFLGAEVNAYFAENIKATPNDLVTLVHSVTSHLPTSEQEVKDEAAASHKDVQPKKILPKNEQTEHDAAQMNNTSAPAGTATAVQEGSLQSRLAHLIPTHRTHKSDERPAQQNTSRMWTVVEVVAGTAFAFVVELIRLRRR